MAKTLIRNSSFFLREMSMANICMMIVLGDGMLTSHGCTSFRFDTRRDFLCMME